MDIIHDHTLAGPLYLCRPSAVPVVTTIHGPLTPSAVDLYRAIGRNASIIAISRDQVSHAPTVPVTRVIHHGLDLSAVPQGTGQGGYACFVGRMCPDKGVVEAIAIARKAGIPLHIAAKMREPEELRYFREVVKPLLGTNEEFIGELGDAEKYALMGEALAFLNPIQWAEPFGLVMIEAMATGTPVVGTPIGSAPEIVQHGTTGFLAPVDELAALLPRAAGLSRAACRAAVEARFSFGAHGCRPSGALCRDPGKPAAHRGSGQACPERESDTGSADARVLNRNPRRLPTGRNPTMTAWNADTAVATAEAVTVVEGSSFCISSHNGDIDDGGSQGVFYQDTRIVSRWILRINGAPREPLLARKPASFHATFVGRARWSDGRFDSPLVVRHQRHVGPGLRDDITIDNYSSEPAVCDVELSVDADQADLFDVKTGRVGTATVSQKRP